MDRNSSESPKQLPARDRIALLLIAGIYIAYLEVVSFETAVMNLLLIIGLYEIAS